MMVADWIQTRLKVICLWLGRWKLVPELEGLQRKRVPGKGNCADKDLAQREDSPFAEQSIVRFSHSREGSR